MKSEFIYKLGELIAVEIEEARGVIYPSNVENPDYLTVVFENGKSVKITLDENYL